MQRGSTTTKSDDKGTTRQTPLTLTPYLTCLCKRAQETPRCFKLTSMLRVSKPLTQERRVRDLQIRQLRVICSTQPKILTMRPYWLTIKQLKAPLTGQWQRSTWADNNLQWISNRKGQATLPAKLRTGATRGSQCHPIITTLFRVLNTTTVAVPKKTIISNKWACSRRFRRLTCWTRGLTWWCPRRRASSAAASARWAHSPSTVSSHLGDPAIMQIRPMRAIHLKAQQAFITIILTTLSSRSSIKSLKLHFKMLQTTSYPACTSNQTIKGKV